MRTQLSLRIINPGSHLHLAFFSHLGRRNRQHTLTKQIPRPTQNPHPCRSKISRFVGAFYLYVAFLTNTRDKRLSLHMEHCSFGNRLCWIYRCGLRDLTQRSRPRQRLPIPNHRGPVAAPALSAVRTSDTPQPSGYMSDTAVRPPAWARPECLS